MDAVDRSSIAAHTTQAMLEIIAGWAASHGHRLGCCEDAGRFFGEWICARGLSDDDVARESAKAFSLLAASMDRKAS